jgi:hypothetical protein
MNCLFVFRVYFELFVGIYNNATFNDLSDHFPEDFDHSILN